MNAATPAGGAARRAKPGPQRVERRATPPQREIATTGVLQRSCTCGNRTIGGSTCDNCRKKSSTIAQRQASPFARTGASVPSARTAALDLSRVPARRQRRHADDWIQPQLVVTAPGDAYEQEADRVADNVVRASTGNDASDVLGMLAELTNPRPAPLAISRFVPPASMHTVDDADGEPAPDTARHEHGGQTLPPPVRTRMERAFGIDFGAVRVHTDGAAHQLAGAIDALAFTQGRHIYFSDGTFAPGTPTGDRLLAHELTHVVQQAGGASGSAQRQPIQRWFIRGTPFHSGVETRFLNANKGKGLLTEGPVPGATRLGPAFDKVGFADLYQSADNNTAIGVEGEWQASPGVNPSQVNPSDDPTKKRRFVDLAPLKRKAETESGKAAYSPKTQGDTKPFTAEFPEWVKFGDVKPMWFKGGMVIVEGGGGGTIQLTSYREGIADFVKNAALDKKVKRGTIGTNLLSGLAIPPELDYRDAAKEMKSPSPNVIGTQWGTERRRYWMFEPPGTGLYYYFSLPESGPAPETKAKLEQAFRELATVKKKLHVPPDEGFHSKLNLANPKRRSARPLPQREQGAPRRPGEAAQGTDTARPRDPAHGNDAARPRESRAQPGAMLRPVQRKDTPRTKRDPGHWETMGRAWEAERRQWDEKYAKPILGSREVKALEERAAINGKLKIHAGDKAEDGIEAQGKQIKTLNLWSGKTGIALGRIRFAMGKSFDKVSAAFEWLKTKLGNFWQKLSGSQTPSAGVGWRKTLVNVLMKAVKLGVRELVSVFFELCANCLEGIVHKIVGRFQDDISEELERELETLRANVEKFEQDLKTLVEERFGSWDKFVEDLRTGQELVNLALSMEALIRLGVQAVACLSPPALGCLWGLVVQVGLEVALTLVMGTEWFQEHVVNHPTIRGMIKQFAGPTIRSLIADTLRGVGLEEYAKDIEPCNKVKELEPPPVPAIDPIPPEKFIEHRAQWERDNRQQMLQDLQFRFQKNIGEPASEGDLEALVAAMGRSGKTKEELKQLIESTPKWSNGKYDVNAVRRRISGGGDKPGPSTPGSGGRVLPEGGLRIRIAPPGGPRVQVGPQVFQPPPGAPPGQDPATLPGVGVRF